MMGRRCALNATRGSPPTPRRAQRPERAASTPPPTRWARAGARP
uniref:Uncharacterized protein n=1 Tax=Arundo donax TaxID=35708 RepID=A0A0A9BJ37_ARUDO